MTKLTIVDVAKLAGLSTATVSRAMHSPHFLRPATLAKVKKVMLEHGYVYNATAGDFSRRKASVIGLLIISNTNKISSTIKAIQEIATEQGFPLISCTCGFDPELERKHILHFKERGVSGVIVIGFMQENLPLIEQLKDYGIPVVFLWDTLPNTKFNYIGIDNEHACYAMTTHLIKEGYRRIGFVCGFNEGVARLTKRYNGYRKALDEHGLTFEKELAISLASSFNNGKRGMNSLLDLPKPPDCVFCASDVLAMGAISAAYERGVAVPKDMAIVGFGNCDIAEYTCPTLTTMHIPGVEMGKLGIDTLMTLIAKPNQSPIQTILPTYICARNSLHHGLSSNKTKKQHELF